MATPIKLIKKYYKYEEKKRNIETENERIEIVAKVIDEITKKHNRSISDRQKRNTVWTCDVWKLYLQIFSWTQKMETARNNIRWRLEESFIFGNSVEL